MKCRMVGRLTHSGIEASYFLSVDDASISKGLHTRNCSRYMYEARQASLPYDKYNSA